MKIPMFWTLLLLLTVASLFVLLAGVGSPWNLSLPAAALALILYRLVVSLRSR